MVRKYLLDDDGYPTEETLNLISAAPPKEALDMVKELWYYPEAASNSLSRAEADMIVGGERIAGVLTGKYLRLATLGWSGNESLVDALKQNQMVWLTCWQLSARGGLFIFKYPEG